jgi:multicomponent Na+:H+ antiporter subunit D
MADALWPLSWPPAPLLLGAALIPWARGRTRGALLLALPAIALALAWTLPDGALVSWRYLGAELTPVRADALARCFGTVFALAAVAGALFALRHGSTLELAAAFFYAGSAIGAVLAGDLITLVVFWELMVLGSGAVIFAGRTPASYAAGMRYLAVHLLGGVLLMAGVMAHVQQTGSASFGVLAEPGVGRWLILAGVLVNAGAPPLSAWLADAYP